MMLFWGHADENENFMAPIVSEEGDLILGAGSVQDENRAFQEGLTATQYRVVSDSTHYLGRAAQYPENGWTDYKIGTITKANYRNDSLSLLGDAARIKNGASVAFCVPPSETRPPNQEHAEENAARVAEDVMGELTEHRTKLRASVLINERVNTLAAVLSMIGCMWLEHQIIFETTPSQLLFSS